MIGKEHDFQKLLPKLLTSNEAVFPNTGDHPMYFMLSIMM